MKSRRQEPGAECEVTKVKTKASGISSKTIRTKKKRLRDSVLEISRIKSQSLHISLATRSLESPANINPRNLIVLNQQETKETEEISKT